MRQRKIICYLFGIGIEGPMTLEEIAVHLELSKERVRQIKDKALKKLKMERNSGVLRSYL